MEIYNFKGNVKEYGLDESKDLNEYMYSMVIIQEIQKNPHKYSKEEMMKMLNAFNIEEMVTIDDVMCKNKHISIEEVINVLIEWGYLDWFGGFHFIHKPYTFNLITPIFKKGKLVDFNEDILLSQDVADRLQKYCDEKRCIPQA